MGRLLKTYLGAALGILSAVVVFQAAQSMLTLYLPRSNEAFAPETLSPETTTAATGVDE